jgi:hypothetical protein
MNCESAKDLLPLYLSGELKSEGLTAVHRHIEECEACRHSVNADRELDDVLRAAILENSPDVSDVLHRVHGAIATPGWKRMLQAGSFRVAALVAIVVFAVVLGLAGFRAHQMQGTIALAAATDHYNDLVLLRHADWARESNDVKHFMEEQFAERDLLPLITPVGASFEKVRLCKLRGTQYAHFVFKTGATETSVFLLPDRNGRNGHDSARSIDAEHGLEVSSFSSPYLTGLVVGNKGHVETQEIANRLAGVL